MEAHQSRAPFWIHFLALELLSLKIDVDTTKEEGSQMI